jgi:glutamine amidotransferase
VVCDDAGDVAATVNHGYTAVAAVARGNIMGVQFHPEKSHRFGMKLLENYCNWNPVNPS